MGYNSDDYDGVKKSKKKKGFGLWSGGSKKKPSSSGKPRRTRSVSPFGRIKPKGKSSNRNPPVTGTGRLFGDGKRDPSPMPMGTRSVPDCRDYTSASNRTEPPTAFADPSIPQGYSSRAAPGLTVTHQPPTLPPSHKAIPPPDLAPETVPAPTVTPMKRFQPKTSRFFGINEKRHILFFCRTEFFVHMCDKAYDHIDADNSGTIDEMELYAGLLLIQLKLGSYVGPAACKPMSRIQVNKMFKKFDRTKSGHLDRQEFRQIMKVLFSNILMRVAVQYTLTLAIVPLIARSALEAVTWDMEKVWEIWTKPRDLRDAVEFTLDGYTDWRITDYPSAMRTFCTKMGRLFIFGSERFWNTVPLTFTTILLGLVLVPWALYCIDDLVQFAVEWLEQRKAKKKDS